MSEPDFIECHNKCGRPIRAPRGEGGGKGARVLCHVCAMMEGAETEEEQAERLWKERQDRDQKHEKKTGDPW